MQIINHQELGSIANFIEQGKVIAFPTETSYGLGCDATNQEAVERVIAIKQRPNDKGLPVLIPKLESLDDFIISNKLINDIAHKYWPGPLNIIGRLANNSQLSPLCSKDGYQSIRLSSSDFIRNLQEIIPRPLVATSANISGEDACYDPQQIINQFKDQTLKPDYIVDAGILPETPASTTIKVTDNSYDILRFGSIVLPPL